MTKEKVEMIPLSSITNKFDVRISLDEDRVVQFAGFYEAGMELPPVRLVKIAEGSYAYIDGRTRGAARAYLNMTDVPAVICNGSLQDRPVELFVEALKSNWGGAKPPTRDDIIHTITRMLESGASQTTCRERLNFLPPGSVRAYIASARSTIMKRKISKALDQVSEGYSVDEASKRCAVPLDTLKDVISGKKGRWGKNRSQEAEYGVALKSYISATLRSTNNGIAKKVQDALQKVNDGDVSEKIVADVLKFWADHTRKTTVRIADWKDRLAAISSEQDNASIAELGATNGQ